MGLPRGKSNFYDLKTTVTHRKLSEAGRKQYVYIAQQLLATLWQGLGYDIARVRNHLKGQCAWGVTRYRSTPQHIQTPGNVVPTSQEAS